MKMSGGFCALAVLLAGDCLALGGERGAGREGPTASIWPAGSYNGRYVRVTYGVPQPEAERLGNLVLRSEFRKRDTLESAGRFLEGAEAAGLPVALSGAHGARLKFPPADAGAKTVARKITPYAGKVEVNLAKLGLAGAQTLRLAAVSPDVRLEDVPGTRRGDRLTFDLNLARPWQEYILGPAAAIAKLRPSD